MKKKLEKLLPKDSEISFFKGEDGKPILHSFSWSYDGYHRITVCQNVFDIKAFLTVGTRSQVPIGRGFSKSKSFDYIIAYCEGWLEHRLDAIEKADCTRTR